MTNKTHVRWGWILLIIAFIMSAPIPPSLILVGGIIIVFRIPRCLWNWFYINVLNKDKIS